MNATLLELAEFDREFSGYNSFHLKKRFVTLQRDA